MSDQITSKEKVLKKLRKALLQKDIFFKPELDFDTDVFVKDNIPLPYCFANNFEKAAGKFYACNNTYHFLDRFFDLAEERNWKQVLSLEDSFKSMLQHCEFPFLFKSEDVHKAEVAITGCDALIARTGSILVSSRNTLSRTASAFPPIHIVIAYRNQLIYGLKEYFKKNDAMQSSYWSIITGPSSTADIERTLIIGAQGPKELIVFYIDQDKEA